jgi:hypothetical protein
MEAATVTSAHDEMGMRWDLLESQPPSGERFTVRLAMPSRSSEVFIAVDTARRRYVLVRIPDCEPCSVSERSSRGIAVQTVEMTIDKSGKVGVFVEVACLEQSGYAALDIVTFELVDALVAGASIGRVRLVQSVLTKWRRFWSGVAQSILSREQQLGLFGELWFLARWLLPSIGAEHAVGMWRGPVGARNDFECPGWAVEVKTSGKLDGGHLVNGLEQLLEPPVVQLFLYSLLVRDEASGVETLPSVIRELRGALTGDHVVLSQFEAMLGAAGFDDAHAPEYDRVKLRIRGQGLYRVAEGFPRLIPSSLPSGLPPGVSNVTYELRLDAAGQWLIGDNPVVCDALLKELSSKGASAH